MTRNHLIAALIILSVVGAMYAGCAAVERYKANAIVAAGQV